MQGSHALLDTPSPPEAIFHAIPQNPVPEGARAGYFRAADGKRMRYGVFPPSGGSQKGTVLLLTGRNEWIEKYFETVRNLSSRGFFTVVLDWRGQGGSDRLLKDTMRGHVRDFGDYVSDFQLLFHQVALPEMPAPFHVLAHSTGALVALLAAPRLTDHVRRMVLSAPLLEIAGVPLSPAAIGRLAGAITGMGLGRAYLGGKPRGGATRPFENNVLTSDPVRYARNMALAETFPHLALGGPTAAWVRAACRAISLVQRTDFVSQIRIPTLFVAAGRDRVVSTPAIERYAPRLRAGALVTIDGARHEILQEADRFREPMLAAFDAFVPGSSTGA